MSDDDFYVEDEPIEEVRAAWKRGEKGVTKGPRDLNRRAKGIVDAAVAAIDETSETVKLTIVATGTVVAEAGTHTDPRVNRGEDTSVTRAVEYQVAASGT